MLQGCYALGSEVEADIFKVLHSAIDKEAAGAQFTCFTGTNVLAVLALLVKNYLFYAELHSALHSAIEQGAAGAKFTSCFTGTWKCNSCNKRCNSCNSRVQNILNALY